MFQNIYLHQSGRSGLEPSRDIGQLLDPFNQTLDSWEIIQKLKENRKSYQVCSTSLAWADLSVVESHPVQEGEGVKVCPGEVVAHKELAASLLETTVQPGQGSWDDLAHQVSHQLQLLLLVSLEHGHDPLVDDIIDGVDYGKPSKSDKIDLKNG